MTCNPPARRPVYFYAFFTRRLMLRQLRRGKLNLPAEWHEWQQRHRGRGPEAA